MIKGLSLLRIEIKSIILVLFVLMLTSCGAPSRSDTTAAVAGGTGGAPGSAGVTVSSNPTSISTYGLANITATVKDASGNPVADGTSVTFTLSDATKGTLSAPTVTTTGGTASVTFTALNKTGSVTITATSGGQTGSVAISITASSVSALTMSASPSSIPASGLTTITAGVVDGTGNPVVDGTIISFSMDKPLMGSLSSAQAVTSNGRATVTFTASATAGSGAVIITATSGTKTGTITVTITGGLTGGSINVAASPTTVITANTSTITATVKDSANNTVSGATVSFSLSSTAATLSSATATTNTSGAATVTLTAGASAASVVVTASASGITGSVTVTITVPTGSGSITVAASPTSITTFGASTITATVRDNTNTPLSGATVNFSLNSTTAALSGATAVTNASGVASVTLTAKNTASVIMVTATSGSLSGTANVTITAAQPATISLTVNPASITTMGTTTVTATVQDSSGNPVPDGTSVSFSMSGGSTYATTANGNGTATTTIAAGNTPGTFTITATVGTISASTTLTVSPSPTGSIAFVSATPSVLGIKGSGQTESALIKFSVKDTNGDPAADGIQVQFTLRGPGGGEYIGTLDSTPTVASGSTVNGDATATLNSGSVAGPVTIIASTNVNSGNQTVLSANIDSIVTTVPVTSTTGFPPSGRIKIGNELIDYTGTTATSFTGCTRGTFSTLAANHLSGAGVYGQTTISSSATPISIGGGAPSETHFNLTTNVFNLMGLTSSGLTADISAYIADRFGNYNILSGTSVSFYAEGGAIDRQGVADNTGLTSVVFRTQSPYPSDTTPASTGDTVSNVYFDGVNEPHVTSGATTYNPRDGWVTILATTLGEESFIDENANGLFTLSYSTTACPPGHTCECDNNGVANSYAGSISGGATCAGAGFGAASKRSEGFVDIGEPFYDKNDDGLRDNGSVAGKPFEEFIDTNGNGSYDGPNGKWDGPECKTAGCLTSKMIWKDIRLVMTDRKLLFWPEPDAANCYNMAPTCAASYGNGSFAIAPASITKGTSGNFCARIGGFNLNSPIGGTTIAATASTGTVAPSFFTAVIDHLSTGPLNVCFSVKIDASATDTSTLVGISVNGGEYATQVSVPLTMSQIVVTTASPLTSGTVGLPYAQTLAATGTSGAFTWTTVGTLPTGLTLSAGTLSGMPTAAGTYTFIATAAATGSISGSKTFTITINP